MILLIILIPYNGVGYASPESIRANKSNKCQWLIFSISINQLFPYTFPAFCH